MTELNLRQAVRGLMIDPSDRVLMVKLHLPHNGWQGWVLPGGGIEDGEDHATALIRELTEETGVPQVFVGPPICERTHIGPTVASNHDGQHETIYLTPCHEFALAPAMSKEELLAEGVVDTRWWSLTDLEATDEVIKPENLVELARQVLEHGAPEQPLKLEIRD